MIDRMNGCACWLSRIAFLVLALTACTATMADTAAQTTPEPGYLPEQYFVPDIGHAWDRSSVAVLPTIIRRTGRTAHSFASQQRIVAYLADKGVSATAKPLRIDLGPTRRPSQWEIFQYGAERVAEAIDRFDTETDYTLVMEILIPDYQAVFGIEVYIVDTEGNHVLSFLLNEHHQIFADAEYFARDSSEEARSEMIARATMVGLEALDRQLQRLRQ